MTNASRFPALNLAVAMAIAGTVGAFVTEAGVDPVTTVFWRCLFGALFLCAWCLLRGYLPDRSLSWGRLARAGLCGVCMVLSWTAFFAGFAKTSIAVMTILYHIQPFFVVLIGVLFLKERIAADQIAWMAAAFIGVVLASGMVVSGNPVTATWMIGIAMALGGAFLYAVVTILAKGLGEQRPEITVLCQTVVGVVMLAPFANFSDDIALASWCWLVGIGVLHTGIAYVMMFSAYPRLTTPVIGVLTFIYPVVAIIIDWAIYGHPIGIAQGVGMALIAVATLGVRLGWRLPVRRAVSGFARQK
ncbi:drug/metabolite transporter (DMT)-like permease [Aminobacter lissarensis]|uniref:Drug/metabolite transporter (DMT)-like permease n=1 Tax=Aminobacter carboxidus TaxID=376165 RepID=A0A8E2BCY4_9HYPH|nr:DMT family transporter [Aminobacter lissarensis]MBB6467423.1 drug/metabolite transporter (DMT)-like permease [Aminobacter lissarensis]